MDAKSEIKARLPIEELVGSYCSLTRKGRNFVCVCPFHNDTRPSFLVSPDKGIGYCFACQTGGDIFSFYQAIESVDFPTALKDLAERTGVVLPKEPHAHGPKRDEKERMRSCLDAAMLFYEKTLEHAPEASVYLETRGVTPELRAAFHIGYAPDSFTQTYDHLLKEGYSKSEIAGAGLAVQKDLKEESMYDRFRHRIMFPIFDHLGNVIGFGGRALRGEEAKYVNSPEGPLYHKSSVLYGLSHAKEDIRKTESVLLVEGYFDVVAAHKAGVKNVVAVSGTALTAEHGTLLSRYARRAVLCLDQDSAGKEAAKRAFRILAPQHLDVHALTIPAKDPDELVQRDPALLLQLLETAGEPYIDLLLKELAINLPIDTPAGKRHAAEEILPLIDALPAAVEREAYMSKAAQTLGVSEGSLRKDLKSGRGTAPQPREKEEVSFERAPFSRMEIAIALAFLYPKHREQFLELLQPEGDDMRSLYDAVVTTETIAGSELSSVALPDEKRERLGVILLFCEENFGSWSENLARREIRKIVGAANRDIISVKQREIIRKLKQARQDGRIDEEQQLLTQYQQSLKLQKMTS